MLPTSDERREVAERLRVYSHDFDFGDSDPFWYVAKAAFGDVYIHTYYSVFARLADLIDPTCHVISGKEVVAELKDGTRLTGVPLSCGHAVFGVSAKDMPRFCCECGARITSEVGDE